MKNILIAAGCLTLGLGFVGCNAHGDNTVRAYMPDMYYSRAYETYGYNDVQGEFDSLKRRGIQYNGLPVPGTIARGDEMPYHFTATSDSARLTESDKLKNPLDTVSGTTGMKEALKEAERLYLINCGICHGTALDGNGPIAASGAYPAVPADLKASKISAYSDGHYYDVITHGIRSMGSYASQLTPSQRWWVIKYIRSKQGGGAAAKDTSAATAATGAPADTTGKGK